MATLSLSAAAAADATALRQFVEDFLVKATHHNRSATELRLQKQLAEDALLGTENMSDDEFRISEKSEND